jgi:hypothetical protein
MELKHVGRVIATGKKCLIAYRTLPGDAYSCLVVPTENLPDSYHDALINLVESNAGQTAGEFAEALDRTQFPDGSRMLPALHHQGRLVKIPTRDVEVLPTNSTSIVLSELNQIIADQQGIAVDELAMRGTVDANAKPADDAGKTTSASVNVPEVAEEVIEILSPELQAKKYRSDADRLAKEAAKYRRLAEELQPSSGKKTDATSE